MEPKKLVADEKYSFNLEEDGEYICIPFNIESIEEFGTYIGAIISNYPSPDDMSTSYGMLLMFYKNQEEGGGPLKDRVGFCKADYEMDNTYENFAKHLHQFLNITSDRKYMKSHNAKVLFKDAYREEDLYSKKIEFENLTWGGPSATHYIFDWSQAYFELRVHRSALESFFYSRFETKSLDRKAPPSIVETINIQGFDALGEPRINKLSDGSVQLDFEAMPPFFAEEMESEFDFEDFEITLEKIVGLPVVRDDREIFIIEQPNPETVILLKSWLEQFHARYL